LLDERLTSLVMEHYPMSRKESKSKG